MSSAEKLWAASESVTLTKEEFERAIRNLPKIPALRIIRSAFGASLAEAKRILFFITEE